jgi:AcrR family transcriptional regulator
VIDKDDKPTRKPRLDAARNRARLLATAKEVFAERGLAASLEEVARRAGVGIGTLYRHFPTRDALVEAVYRTEHDQVIAAADDLSANLPPVEALRAWMRLLVDYLMIKYGMMPLLNALSGGTGALFAASGVSTQATMNRLVDRAVAAGDLTISIDPMDLLRAVAGVVITSDQPGRAASAYALIDILIDGLRTGGREQG